MESDAVCVAFCVFMGGFGMGNEEWGIFLMAEFATFAFFFAKIGIKF